jgi:outer membrane protein assembly factor BamB
LLNNAFGYLKLQHKEVARDRRRLILRALAGICGLAAALSAPAGDLFLMGDRFGYAISRAQGGSCFAIAPSSIAPADASLLAMFPDNVRRPAQVLRVLDAGLSIMRIGEDDTACKDSTWAEGENLEATLGRTGIGLLQIGSGKGGVSGIHVHISEIDGEGYFSITPVRDSVRLIEAMGGSRVLLEDSAAGMLLSVDESQNRGRVIRQDHLSKLIEPFFESLPTPVLAEEPAVVEPASDGPVLAAPDIAGPDTAAPELTESEPVAPILKEPGSADLDSIDADATNAGSINTDSIDVDSTNIDSTNIDSVSPVQMETGPNDADLAKSVPTDAASQDAAQAKPRPEIVQQFFIGKQTWRNNPTIVGNRLFVGSSGRVWNEPDVLDGVYSFNIDTGERMWFVHTDADFNDLIYTEGLVVGGTDSGKVLGIGARTGTTYWSRQFYGKVHARPARLRAGVAVATSAGGLFVLSLKDGLTKARSDLDSGVRGGLVASQGELWVATVSGTLYRYMGFGEVQLRRESKIFYPDELGNELSGKAIEWYERLGKGRGQRAKFFSAPLVLDDRVILSVVRARHYDYPPVMAFLKNGTLDWIGTDPKGIVGSAFGDSRLTPASWYGRLIVADPHSNAIYSLATDSGEVVWATNLGHPEIHHRASPVVANDYVYVARQDGFLHKLQASDGKRIWSMFIGQNGYAGRTYLEDEPLPDSESEFAWDSQISHPILSTPAVSDGTIVVGTDEGYLYVIKDPD